MNRLVDPRRNAEETFVYRPTTFDEFVGQEKVKQILHIALMASRKSNTSLDHVLFYGPPGMGKSTLASVLAREQGGNFYATSGPVLTRVADLAALFSELNFRDTFFIDEIHRIPAAVEESLYPAMENFSLNIVMGKGASARILKISLPFFTLVGATTRPGLLSSPLRNRFGFIFKLDFYSVKEIEEILQNYATVLQVPTTSEAIRMIAIRGRGTPRVALRLFKRVADFAKVEGNGKVEKKITERALTALEIDEYGLDAMDRKLLWVMAHDFQGGPAGLDTLSAVLGEERDTLVDVYEPFLIKMGLLRRTPQGRVLTKKSVRLLQQKPL